MGAMNFNRRRVSYQDSEPACEPAGYGKRWWFVKDACVAVSKIWGREVTALELYRWTKSARHRIQVRQHGHRWQAFTCYDFEIEAWANQMRATYPDGVPMAGCVPYHQEGDAVVYFVQSEVGKIKIGTSRNLSQRLRELSSGSPVPIRLLLSIPGDRSKELELHMMFAESRSHGEWFEPTQDLISFIRDNGGSL